MTNSPKYSSKNKFCSVPFTILQKIAGIIYALCLLDEWTTPLFQNPNSKPARIFYKSIALLELDLIKG